MSDAANLRSGSRTTRRREFVSPTTAWVMWWHMRAAVLGREQPELAIACRQGFVLRTDQLADAGITRARARGLVQRGAWSAPAPGVVAVVDPSDDDPPPARWTVQRRGHALACAAAAMRNTGFVVSGTSAPILHGLPTIDVPNRPLLTAPVRRHAHRRGKATLRADDITNWFGVPVLAPARAVVDVARGDRREGLVVADAALHEGLVDVHDLARVLEAQRGWCGVRTAREILALADGRAESPLESLTRLALHDDGFPAPELQVEFAVPGFREAYRVDLYWPQFGVVLECDGRLKYREDIGWQDKRRDITLHRAHHVTVERVVWADVLHDWPATSAYLRTVLGLPRTTT